VIFTNQGAKIRNGTLVLPCGTVGRLTVFTGHMSGVNWIPPWALTPGQEVARFRVVSGGQVVRATLKNWYSDATIRQAQTLLAREVAAALCHHPALWAYDLGNENSNCVVPPSRTAALAWLEAMADAIRAVDTTHPITLGLQYGRPGGRSALGARRGSPRV
jgi:endo-1,4-beta-mannosidase